MRLGQKYDMSLFRTTAHRYLRSIFPMDLDMWDASRISVDEVVGCDIGFLFDVINSAYDCQLLVVVPAAFLHMFRLHKFVRHFRIIYQTWLIVGLQEEILHGVENPDDNQQAKALQRQALFHAIKYRSLFLNMTHRAMTRMLSSTGKNYPYTIPVDGCTNTVNCSIGIVRLLGGMLGSGASHEFLNNFVQATELFSSPDPILCHQCHWLFCKKYREVRLGIWNMGCTAYDCWQVNLGRARSLLYVAQYVAFYYVCNVVIEHDNSKQCDNSSSLIIVTNMTVFKWRYYFQSKGLQLLL